MAVAVRVNGGSTLQLGTGTPTQCEQQLSTIELLSDSPTSDVTTYGGATTVTGQAKRVLHLAGYQDRHVAASVCKYLEDNAGKWVDFIYWQYGGTTASPTNPKVTGQVLCVTPARGGTVDTPETFDITMGITGYTVATTGP
jgi:hypothetical protein